MVSRASGGAIGERSAAVNCWKTRVWLPRCVDIALCAVARLFMN